MHVIVILTIRYSVCMVDACYSYSHHLVFAPNHIILPSGSKKALPVIATRSYVTTSVTCTACIHVYVVLTKYITTGGWSSNERCALSLFLRPFCFTWSSLPDLFVRHDSQLDRVLRNSATRAPPLRPSPHGMGMVNGTRVLLRILK